MTNPLDGNGVEALKPCPFCGAAFLIAQEPHDNHPVAGMFYIYHDYGPISSAARACIIDVRRHFASREEAITAWNLRTPTPSQTAVEPVARFNPVLDTEDGGYGFVTMKQSEHGQWVPLSTLTAQAAALVAAEKERDEAWGDLSKVAGAIGSVRFMDPPDGGDVTLAEQVARMREALEAAESEVATLKGRVAELEAVLTPSARTKAALIGEFSFAIDVMEPDADGDDAEVVSREITVPWTTIKEIMSAIRRLTHQEKNNG